MAREIARFLVFSVLVGIGGCGGNPIKRQLVSISVSPATATGTNTAFTATGTYNAPPFTVTPLPVSWWAMGPGIDPPGDSYTLVNGNHAFNAVPCPVKTSLYTVIALAPNAPNAPSSGSVPSKAFSDLVIDHTTVEEDGFLTGTAQFTCQ